MDLLTPSDHVESRHLGMNMLFNKAEDPNADHSVTATQGVIMEILATAIFVQLILNVTEPSSPSSNW